MKLSKEEEIKLMEMIVDLDKQIKRLKIRRKNYKNLCRRAFRRNKSRL